MLFHALALVHKRTSPHASFDSVAFLLRVHPQQGAMLPLVLNPFVPHPPLAIIAHLLGGIVQIRVAVAPPVPFILGNPRRHADIGAVRAGCDGRLGS
ncbi:hypothetical protein TL16_g00402 [Triparma laevis f. inornata]|uniref:Uncharacterized protein n=1 Tax=Triparma laevis f. inornata TaxID=1714386 RepID=A0A9W7DNU1_9STRA|nr:hypothetical protein TL16_g00402 [Triparma laevis f. inornata]